MLNRIILINAVISLLMFAFIFKRYAGQSGGDLAIIFANVIFGVLQLLANSIYLRIKTKSNYTIRVQLAILAIQSIELVFFIIFGYQVNEWLK